MHTAASRPEKNATKYVQSAYPGVRDIHSTINTKIGYDESGILLG